jgi:cytochrome c oxidase assembly protein subunit 15
MVIETVAGTARRTVAPIVGPDDGRVRAAIRVWLFCIAGLVWAMVLVGGATRMIGVGLSVPDGSQVVGMLPPFSDAAWHEAFAHYREIARLGSAQAGLTFDEFHGLYVWEWSHRFIGWSIGLLYLGPLVAFVVRGAIRREELPRFLAILCLGAFQCGIGCWLLRSGLGDRGSPAPYRLALHLTTAAALFALLLATALTLSGASGAERPSLTRRIGAVILLLWVFAEIFLGALVAGNEAGLVYETWPLMGDRLMPPDILTYDPLWRNLFENPATVQFAHRCGAYALFALALAQFVSLVVSPRGDTARLTAFALGFAVAFQILVGVATLLLGVPVSLGLVHQAMAMLVLAVAVVHAVTVFAPGRAESALPIGTRQL